MLNPANLLAFLRMASLLTKVKDLSSGIEKSLEELSVTMVIDTMKVPLKVATTIAAFPK